MFQAEIDDGLNRANTLATKKKKKKKKKPVSNMMEDSSNMLENSNVNNTNTHMVENSEEHNQPQSELPDLDFNPNALDNNPQSNDRQRNNNIDKDSYDYGQVQPVDMN